MGGTTVLNLGKIEQQLKATVVMSMGGTASLNVPQNLLFAVGFYEQLNPPSKINKFLGKVTEKNCNLVNNTCGDFKLGNARELFISPSSDHIIAPYVVGIIISFVMGILLVVEFGLNLAHNLTRKKITNEVIIRDRDAPIPFILGKKNRQLRVKNRLQ